MKNLLNIILLIPCLVLAQAPQGFTYQAVATDNNGLELVEQNVSIRVSILSESSTGVEQWIETHSTTTDGFGLFTITIGEGTSTGNGAQSSFSDIDWGGSEHHLKIEMDVDGGSDYQLLGISQLMSVPYALYAESSNTDSLEVLIESLESEIDNLNQNNAQIDSTLNQLSNSSINYDSISNYLMNDSLFQSNIGGGNINFGDYVLMEPGELNLVSVGWQLKRSDTIQALEDGFLFGQFDGYNSSSNGETNVYISSTESFYISSTDSYASTKTDFGTATQQTATFMIPIKKNYYYFVSSSYNSNHKIYWIPLVNTENEISSSVGPSFIDPIIIHSGNLCESNDWITEIQFNIDSILNESVTNIILHSTFQASAGSSSYSNSWGAATIQSWNGVFATPIMNIQSSNNGQASYNNDELTRHSNQVTLPISNSLLNIQIVGSGWCPRVTGDIKIVGYFD